MWKNSAVRNELSMPECVALLYVGTDPRVDDLPVDQAGRLLDLGLARIDGDRLGFTALGREVAAQAVFQEKPRLRVV